MPKGTAAGMSVISDAGYRGTKNRHWHSICWRSRCRLWHIGHRHWQISNWWRRDIIHWWGRPSQDGAHDGREEDKQLMLNRRTAEVGLGLGLVTGVLDQGHSTVDAGPGDLPGTAAGRGPR